MATRLEKELARAEQAGPGVLVPLFEQYHKQFHADHWDNDDIEWLHDLMQRVAARELQRSEQTVFSPSGLGGCLRQVFLNKNYRKLDIPRKLAKRIETHYYFENGSWIHLKIQLKLYKLHKAGEIELLATEIPVRSKHGDNSGTLDAVFRRGRTFGVDIKGWNSRDFLRLAGGDCPVSAQIQLGNYIILANANDRTLPSIEAGLIFAENKAGPMPRYPAAVAEYEIPMVASKELVRTRLERLRAHEEKNTLPRAECTSTLQKDFKDCAFRGYCKAEVLQVERRNRKSKGGDSNGSKITVATPKRSDRSRRRSSK